MKGMISVNRIEFEKFEGKVMHDLYAKLAYYEMLARHTKKSVKLKQHEDSIKFMKDVIAEAKKEYDEARNSFS